MKKNLLIICFLSMAGMYAQQEPFIVEVQYTPTINETEESKTTTASRIDNLTYSIEEYEDMIKRGKELTIKIIEHKKLTQTGSMTKTQVRELKRDLLEAKLLNYRIDDFTSKYLKAGYSLIDNVSTEVLSDHYDFSKTLEISSQYAGF